MSTPQFRPQQLAHAIAIALATGLIAQVAAQTPATAEETNPRPKEDAVRLGTITVVGQGDKLGAGQILNEDATKARSTVTKDATEKDRATGNPFQALSLLPSINTFNHDATGLFGGGLTIRGFGADQIGFTINGVPVNDSGNYAVFPQEYVDQENACTQSVAQGSADNEAPHVGATGGSVSINSCDPEEKTRFRLAQTLGQLHLSRTFLRADTGRFADNKAKVFVSYSHTEADKWKGAGGAVRDHIDAAFSLDLAPGARILGSAMYNKAVNNNILSISLAQLAANGYNYDLSTSFTPGHLTPVKGTAQKEVGPSPAYYKLAANPFENLIASVSGSFNLSDNTTLKVQPYLWTGYGTGGTQQRAISETAFLNTATGKTGAGVDLNGDGDTLDNIIVASSNVTKTTRPGVTAEINYAWGDHAIKAGVWYERAVHEQTAPAVAVDANGNPADIWLRNGQILRPDGSAYQGRNWVTVSPAYQVYVADSWRLMNDRALINLGLRAPQIERNFTNNPSEAANSQAGYNFVKSYSDVLPQAGARLYIDKEQQVFANIGKNFRAPPNFAFAPTGNNVKLVNGVPTLVGEILAETSVNTDLGYRFQSKALTLAVSAFNIDFKNRQANAFNPITNTSIYTNAGRVNNRGIELELGTQAISGFSVYGSVSAQKSTVKDDLVFSKTVTLPTTGKQFALTPEFMAGLSVQYATGPYYARLKAKHTGRQYATILNDETVPAYTTADFDAGYRLGSLGFMKNLQLRFNVSNITNAKYRNPSSGTVVNAQPFNGAAASTVFYYLGAPRMATISVSVDF
jgi:iron complex outermembrane recepter protein